MLNWNDIITEQQVQEQQQFFKTSPKLQYEYDNLCKSCSRLSYELHQIIDKTSKEYLIKKEYLEVQQTKLDKFVKYHDIKF